MSSRQRRRRLRRAKAPGDPGNIGWLYVLPGLLFYGLFTLAPLLHTVYYSLFDWDGLTPKRWVGLANYSEAIRDHVLLRAFIHSAVLIAFYALIPVIIGLLLTAALTRTRIRGFRFFRTTLFLPQLIAGVVIAQAWVWVYDASGPLNRGLERDPAYLHARWKCGEEPRRHGGGQYHEHAGVALSANQLPLSRAGE